MENFFKIRADKQEHIINAAIKVFGRQGYKKASVADIAQEAGITKGMITYYFGSKRTLYVYLLDACKATLVQSLDGRLTPEITDFFERIKIFMDIQLSAIKAFPAIVSFMTSLFKENDPEVVDEIEKAFDSEFAEINQMLLAGSDMTKFKDGVDTARICQLVLWSVGGFMEALYETTQKGDIDKAAADFNGCMDIMREAFY